MHLNDILIIGVLHFIIVKFFGVRGHIFIGLIDTDFFNHLPLFLHLSIDIRKDVFERVELESEQCVNVLA